ncbi:ROK family transcriptional regulator [Alkalibacterium sp. 20]|uniref:ROK family transcriptional regulator n=1 Tax=Alkalibacterium sp. 20 TaxID=1798803 RepID=UPI0009002098|nr:ROK family transcriptional regulator [Alkalibacterium sp. 20]OJF92038.1 MarR family transcriptional regulator [Alkalibacterium sp. 20]
MLRMKSNIRENNSVLVLTEITNHPEISRTKISEITGLNKATVSEIVRKLIEDDYVIEIGSGNSTKSGGRRPILLTVNKKAGVSISFDVRYDRISYLITYLDGEKIDYEIKETDINKDNIVTHITTVVDAFRSTMKKSPFGIIGVTISVHGVVNKNMIEFTPYFDLDQLNLIEELKERIDLPIHIENEANLSALAEAAFDTEHQNIISFSAHTGVGAGIILDSQLYRGYNGRSGEVGHTVLYPDGLNCPCGNHGCLEQYCSTKAIVRNFQQLRNNKSLNFDDLLEAYRQNDVDTQNLIQKFSKDLGIGLMNIIGNYDPEIVYINAEILEEIPELLGLLQHSLSSTIYKSVPIRQSKLGHKASLYGATVHNLKEFLNVDNVGFDLDMEKVLEV